MERGLTTKSRRLFRLFYYAQIYGEDVIVIPYFNGGNMTDKRKIEILEQLLDERDTQIQELQMRITELEETVESYKSVDNDMRELRQLIKNGHKLNQEYSKMNLEYNLIKRNFRRDMRKVLKSAK